MPALPRKLAAAHLRIPIRELCRLTADGAGIAKQGGRGRGNATLYDVAAIAELLPPAPGRRRVRRSPEIAAQLKRGAQALTLIDELLEEFSLVVSMDLLFLDYKVPKDKQAKVLNYILARAIQRILRHFDLRKSVTLSDFGPLC